MVAATPATILARRIWAARADVVAAPGMIVVVYGAGALGGFGLWMVVFLFRCWGPGWSN